MFPPPMIEWVKLISIIIIAISNYDGSLAPLPRFFKYDNDYRDNYLKGK
jgi:hypothetical protein